MRVGYLAVLAVVALGFGLFAPRFVGLSSAKKNPCLGTLVVDGPTTCTDCDPACDHDSDNSAANGQCTFRVRGCVNTPASGCTAADIKSAKVTPGKFGISVTPNGTSSVCGAFTNVVVKLKNKGKKKRKQTITLTTKANGHPKQSDKDKAKLECDPQPVGQSCPSPSTTSTTTSTTMPPVCNVTGTCCGSEEITLRSTAGTLRVDGLTAFPFPADVITTMDSGPANPADCSHDVVVGPGGFFVPHFGIPSLNYCSEVMDKHCESGSMPAAEGAGKLWDAHGAPGCAKTNVTKVADTSDGSCGTLGTGCTTGAGGAGSDTLGNIDSTTSFVTSGSAGVRSALDFRVTSRTWSDSLCSPGTGPDPNCCVTSNYGDDTAGNGELLITLFDFILSPTTDTETAMFVDQNGDGCKRAGAGFPAVPNPPGPDLASLQGSPAPGPCCVVGQATTVVSVGVGFSGGAPLFDLGFLSTIPNTIASCGAYPVTPPTCVVTTNPCLK